MTPELHDEYIEDVIEYAESLGYDAKNTVWWGYSEGNYHYHDYSLLTNSLCCYTNDVRWGYYSEGAAMVSQHVNYLLRRDKVKQSLSRPRRTADAHLPRAMVLESNGGQYCYAFRPAQEAVLQSTPFWKDCSSWSNNNCCPKGLTEQYYYEHKDLYSTHPPVLLLGNHTHTHTHTHTQFPPRNISCVKCLWC